MSILSGRSAFQSFSKPGGRKSYHPLLHLIMLFSKKCTGKKRAKDLSHSGQWSHHSEQDSKDSECHSASHSSSVTLIQWNQPFLLPKVKDLEGEETRGTAEVKRCSVPTTIFSPTACPLSTAPGTLTSACAWSEVHMETSAGPRQVTGLCAWARIQRRQERIDSNFKSWCDLKSCSIYMLTAQTRASIVRATELST